MNEINPISYHWNKTSQGCVPRSMQLPAPYKGISRGTVLVGTPAHTTVICLAVLVGCLGLVSVVWLAINPRLTIVKLAQPGHTAAFCLSCIAFQLSWLSYLGPPTAGNYYLGDVRISKPQDFHRHVGLTEAGKDVCES